MKIKKPWQGALFLAFALALIYGLRRWGEGESPAEALLTGLLFVGLLLVLMGVTKYWPQIQSRWPALARRPNALLFGWIFLVQLVFHRQESWPKMVVGGLMAALVGTWCYSAWCRRQQRRALSDKPST